MTSAELKATLEELSPAELRRVAPRFAFELTIAARDTYRVGSDEVAMPKRLRSFNERLHRVCAAAAMDADDGRRDDALRVLLSQASIGEESTELDHDVEAALERSLVGIAAHQ